MRSRTPTISVVMLVYNHEKYLTEAIRSVLDQDFTDYEFIIVNDGSSDGSETVIRSFRDDRIVYLSQPNQGPSVAANNGVLAARGKYIAPICGDDAWFGHRLRVQHEALAGSTYRMAFCWMSVIDEEGLPIAGGHPVQVQFGGGTRSRAELLRAHFFDGPQLSPVTAMVERDLLLEAGLYHLTSIQAQDFDMFYRIALKHDALVVPEQLVKYRIRADQRNLSAGVNAHRTWFELYQIYREMFDEVPIELFREAFSDKLRKPDFREGIEYELEKAFLYLSHKERLIRTLGNEKLFRLLRDARNLEIAKASYGLDLRRLYEINLDADIAGDREFRRLQDWCGELTGAKEYLLGQIETRDVAIAEIDRALSVKKTMLAERDAALAAMSAALAEKDAVNTQQAAELAAYRDSPWTRLGKVLSEERWSARKSLKLAYLMTLLAAPRSLRPKIEAGRERARRRPK